MSTAPISPERKSTFRTAFSEDEQRTMLHDDSEAWSSVTGILFTIVVAGVLLGILGVLLAM
jgi:hypothetical protein